ncbi:hypothetical protein AB4Y43_39415, partial [Paraburkholderia sp. BR10872]|uniref:hypothetical protein n=1 Tax=Paraburkholderia sp. BR10872 TaxID=3236989 RepID=UPI0034D1C312
MRLFSIKSMGRACGLAIEAIRFAPFAVRCLRRQAAKAAAETGGRRSQQAFSSGERKKGVDEAEKILHNLVSLLLT